LPVSTSTNRDDFEAFSFSELREPFALRLDIKAGSGLLACSDADVRDHGFMGRLILYRVCKPKLGIGTFEHHPFFRDAKATIWERISSGFAPSAPDVAMRRIISACL
jgi:hypothetical protein